MPSQVPTSSERPSSEPSISDRPSEVPSERPSRAPTQTPSRDPTSEPRAEPQDIGRVPSFRLKLYWEDGYFWQEERREREWCMDCSPGGCSNGDHLQLEKCGSGITRFEFVGNIEEVQIKVSDENLCLEFENKLDIKLRRCDSGDDKQKFGPGRGDFEGRRFELIPTTKTNRALSQHHHPRENEEGTFHARVQSIYARFHQTHSNKLQVYAEEIHLARVHKTSYWEKD